MKDFLRRRCPACGESVIPSFIESGERVLLNLRPHPAGTFRITPKRSGDGELFWASRYVDEAHRWGLNLHEMHLATCSAPEKLIAKPVAPVAELELVRPSTGRDAA